ncbi:unnamed protein product [Prorocentrum cordatum]|uniref:N-acetyltransferase domain-containing protein n=1 Tax=Prorocentrum cordatum TaxID=2364126 RepID=A0ABN9SS03_9DINO|nr:unnamed protein product [Polarella glacialis]
MRAPSGGRVMVEVRRARKDQAGEITEVVNWAYRGKYEGGDAGAWTTERDIIGGIRTTELDVLEVIASCDRSGPRTEILQVATGTSGAVIGTIHAKRVAPGVVELGLFAVDPDFQSEGVGSHLVKTAEKHAYWKMDAKVAVMYVLTVRTELLSWYGRLGYKATAERVPFPPPEAGVGVPRQPGLEFVSGCRRRSSGTPGPSPPRAEGALGPPASGRAAVRAQQKRAFWGGVRCEAPPALVKCRIFRRAPPLTTCPSLPPRRGPRGDLTRGRRH